MADNAENDATFPAGAERAHAETKIGHANEDTLASVAPPADLRVAIDDTLAGQPAVAASPVVVRAGGADYPHLLTIERQHYVVGKEIARGGMGKIMVARDRRLGRPVAVKELLSTSSDLRVRFEREARITAKLQHPAIVNILEAGTWPSGEPFYVMKFVAGESLDKAIARRTTLAQRLALLPNVITVVDALAYAHSVRIIHRDLKPANVLVGDFGETVVIDWGLAKDLDDDGGADVDLGAYRAATKTAGETVAGAIMGTPAYMPAEQATGGVVDERADVYALGAMLYHLLAGRAPYTGKTTDEILDGVIAGPPPPVNDRTTDVPADLVTIVNKAMARDAAARYATAKDLAHDLKNFQTGQLVGAHHYSMWQLVARWIRRHRTPVVVAGIAIALLLGLGIVSVRRIVREQEATNDQRQHSDKNRGQAEDLVTFMLTDLSEKLQPLGKLPLLGDVARKAVRYYDERGDTLGDRAQEMQVKAHIQLGQIFLQQDNIKSALAEQETALAQQLQRTTLDPGDAKKQQFLATSHGNLGDVFRTHGQLGDAMTEYRAATALLEPLVARQPTNTLQHDLATMLEALGFVLMTQGDPKSAVEKLRAAQAIAEKLVAIDPSNAIWQHDLWVIEGELGDGLLRQRDVTGALAAYQASLAIVERLAASDRTDLTRLHDVATMTDRVAEILERQGNFAGALERFRASLVTTEALLGRDPTNEVWQQDLALGHDSIARVLRSQGNDTGAIAELRVSLSMTSKLAIQNPNDADRLRILSHDSLALGELLQHQNDPGALELYRTGVACSEKLVAREPTDAVALGLLYNGYDDIGEIFKDRGDWSNALRQYRASLAIAKRLATADPKSQDDLALESESVGDALLGTADNRGALEMYRSVIPIRDALVAGEPTNTGYQENLATIHRKIGEVMLVQHDPSGASGELRSALDIEQRLAKAAPSNAGLAAAVLRLKARIDSCCGH